MLDAIIQLLPINQFSHESYSYLLSFQVFVKTYLWVILLIAPMRPAWATILDNQETLILSKGEQKELNLSKFHRFSVGNREVITYKYISKESKFLVKGSKLGFTDLVFWKNNSKRLKTYRIYVLSKRMHLKMASLVELLETTGLDVEIKGPVIIIKGEVNNFYEYKLLKQVAKAHKDKVFFHIKLQKEFRNLLISKIYTAFYQNGFKSISCYDRGLSLICNLPKNNLFKELKEKLQQEYFIEFINQSMLAKHNYIAKIKITQIERLDGKEISFGLNQIATRMEDLFNKGLTALVSNNLMILRENNLSVSTLAEPKTVLRIGHPAKIQLGSQIPYQSFSAQGIPNTNWQFAGLSLNLDLKEENGKLLLHYATEVTRPVKDAVSGNKESSTVSINPEIPIQLFDITMRTTVNDQGQIPILGDIPLLGKLFASQNDQVTYKKIIGHLLIETLP
ncbi:MAG: pilus assembly protein N-terminal domain-containing protein [Bacteriovoracia bacterium]